MTLFFMSIPLIYGVMFSTTWLFGGELVETLPKERLSVVYGRLGAASMVGGLLGAGVAKLLAARLTASAFILIGAVGLLLAVAVILLGHAKFPFRVAGSEGEDLPAEPSEMMPAFSEIFNTLRFDYVRTLVLVAGAAAVVGVLIEFQFYVLASLTTTGARASTDFFANFYIVVTLVALLLQLFAMPILQRKIGIRGSLLVLPLSLLSGALLLAVNASGIGRAALRVAEGGLKSSIHRANWEQAFLPIGQPRRLVVKVLVDGLSSRVAEGLAAGLLLVWLHGFVQQRSLNLLEMSWISYLIAGSCFAWIVLVSRLARDLSPDCCPELRRGELTSDLPLPDSCCVTKALLKRQSVSSIAF
ncbi:MAG: hypothetical protein O2968_19185 [Acidobacteria bacterium]|nr:hypothetical protein [Acidobacteriota bacterium]